MFGESYDVASACFTTVAVMADDLKGIIVPRATLDYRLQECMLLCLKSSVDKGSHGSHGSHEASNPKSMISAICPVHDIRLQSMMMMLVSLIDRPCSVNNNDTPQ